MTLKNLHSGAKCLTVKIFHFMALFTFSSFQSPPQRPQGWWSYSRPRRCRRCQKEAGQSRHWSGWDPPASPGPGLRRHRGCSSSARLNRYTDRMGYSHNILLPLYGTRLGPQFYRPEAGSLDELGSRLCILTHPPGFLDQNTRGR